jgi:hypothetical protein
VASGRLDRSPRMLSTSGIYSLLDINTAVVHSRAIPMIGYRVDHFIETRVNLAGHFDAISARTGIWCHDNEVEHATPKALIENIRRAFDTIDNRRILPPFESGIREQAASMHLKFT